MGMRVAVWIALGMAAAFLVAALISVVLGGPAWPYYLGLGVLSFLAALAIGLGYPPQTPD